MTRDTGSLSPFVAQAQNKCLTMILEHKLVRMFLEIPEYKDVESRKANKQQKSKCTRQIDYLNSWNGKQSTRFRSSGKQLKNPSGRAAETNYLRRHQMFINVSLLPVCILCQKFGLSCCQVSGMFFAQLWSVFLFEKAPGGSSSSSATEYEEAGHTQPVPRLFLSLLPAAPPCFSMWGSRSHAIAT